MRPVQPSLWCYPNLLAPLCRQALFLPLICLYMGMLSPIQQSSAGCSFESPGGSSAPSSVPNATPTPQTGSLSLVDEQTSAPFMFLPVQFGDLAVSALVDSGAMHNFLAASLLPKLQDSPSFVSNCSLPVAGYPSRWGCGAGSSVGHFGPRGGR